MGFNLLRILSCSLLPSRLFELSHQDLLDIIALEYRITKAVRCIMCKVIALISLPNLEPLAASLPPPSRYGIYAVEEEKSIL